MKMKKALFLGLSLVLCLSLLTGCRGNRPMETTAPTKPATTVPTTQPTTVPAETTLPTTGTTPRETVDRGNGPLETTDATAGTEGTAESRIMPSMPKVK